MSELTRGDHTRKLIRQAIVRVEKGRPKIVARNRKMSIAAVAEEAGVSRASIHNNYPDLAERIRVTMNRTARRQRDEKQELLQAEKVKNRSLRAENAEMRSKVAALASKNRTLTDEINELRTICAANNVRTLDIP